MGYDTEVIQAASRQLELRRIQREREFSLRQEQIYKKLPRTEEIDRRLKLTVAAAAAAALRKGINPSEAIDSLRKENLALQEERRSLLKNAGYSPDALVDQPVCPNCNDTGWRGARMCTCLKELCAKEQISQLSSMLNFQGQSFENFRFDLYRDDDADPQQSKPSSRDNMRIIKSLCEQYAREFPRFYFKNLFLTGAPGLGKTFLSASIAQVVASRGFSVVYDSAVNIFSQFEAKKFEKDADAQESTRRYLNCDLLILDDLGSEMRTSFTQSVLYEILNSRLVSDRCTVISSNLSLNEIAAAYTPQIHSRIAGEYRSLPFYGNDIRQFKKNQI